MIAYFPKNFCSSHVHAMEHRPGQNNNLPNFPLSGFLFNFETVFTKSRFRFTILCTSSTFLTYSLFTSTFTCWLQWTTSKIPSVTCPTDGGVSSNICSLDSIGFLLVWGSLSNRHRRFGVKSIWSKSPTSSTWWEIPTEFKVKSCIFRTPIIYL